MLTSGYVNVKAEPPVVIQLPLTAKQPPVRFMPLANVDDAVVPVTESRFVDIPPINVEVAVDVAKRFPTVNCVPVAVSAPSESVVTIEFGAPVKDVPFIVTVVTLPESVAVTPPPTKFIVVLAVRSTPSS